MKAELTHALAFLYLAAAQATDGTLTADEMRTLAEKLGTQAPELTLEELGLVLRQSVDAYKALGTVEQKLERAHAHAETLRDALDEAQRKAIVDDLLAIARADGRVSDEEVAFIATIGMKMGLYAKEG